MNCTGESVGIVEVPHPVAGIAGSAGSFSIGIENDPLTGGSRLVEWTGASAIITNRSGVTRNITNDWVCVAGRYGVAAGPAGYFKYQAAASYNRSGAAQDTLQFMAQDSLGPRYAVWFPGRNASQTASNATQIAWTASGTNGVLTFPGPGGNPAQITVSLASAVPLYPPYAPPISSVTASSWQTNYPPANAVDGNLANFWVSLLGPTNHAEWLKVTFPRVVAMSGFQVYPRTENGGYGPKDIQMIVNVTNAIPSTGIPTSGTLVYEGTMSPTTAFDARLPQPVSATNAVLVVTSAYDRGISTSAAQRAGDRADLLRARLAGHIRRLGLASVHRFPVG